MRVTVQGSRARPAAPKPSRRSTRGASLVELMVGLALGLLVVAGGLSFLTLTAREHRALVVESRLTQELATAADVITRDVRRAGHWGAAASGVWAPDGASVVANPYTAMTPESGTADAIDFRYARDAAATPVVDASEQFGFRLRSGTLQVQLGGGQWQALTDAATVTVTNFEVVPQVEAMNLASVCASDCPAGSTTCPPRLHVRSLSLSIRGQAVADARMVRTLRSAVRLRNDVVVGACGA